MTLTSSSAYSTSTLTDPDSRVNGIALGLLLSQAYYYNYYC